MEDRTLIRTSAPPPPSEVKVRTMQSDLASMAQSGGGAPRFQNVEVSGLSIEKEEPAPARPVSPAPTMAAAPAAAAPNIAPTTPTPSQPIAMQPTPAAQQEPVTSPAYQPQSTFTQSTTVLTTAPKKNIFPILIVTLVALLAIGGVSYFAYVTLFAGSASQAPSASTSTTSSSTATGVTPSSTSPASTTTSAGTVTPPPANTPASLELSSAHVSLFSKPADQIITITLPTSNSTTYRKSMNNSLAGANAGVTMIEVHPQGSDGKPLNINGLLTATGATSLLNQQALAYFNPDATFYVYLDKTGMWPGYVLQLMQGQSQSSAAVAVAQLESFSNIANLFLADPGTPSSDGFTDSTIANLPVRVLLFAGIAAPSYFTYGWNGNYLIISTSQNGFANAVANLPQQ